MVTTAQPSRAEELAGRQRRYMVTMGVRTVAFVLAVFLFRGVARYVAIAAALVLPYVAVVFANAAPKRSISAAPYVEAEEPPALERAPEPVVVDLDPGGPREADRPRGGPSGRSDPGADRPGQSRT